MFVENSNTMIKHNKKNIKAIAANLGPASTDSKVDKTFDETFEFTSHEDKSNEVNLPAVGSVVKFNESDIPKAKNIEDVLREFIFKQAHLFIKHNLTYGICYFAQTKIGEIKISTEAAPIGITFEDLHIELSKEEIDQFLSERVKLQKEYLKTF